MSKFLTLQDFKWIQTCEEKETGYYSFKENGWELCVEHDKGWTVYLCNKFEEVLEETDCKCREGAIILVNKLYIKFPRLDQLYNL